MPTSDLEEMDGLDTLDGWRAEMETAAVAAVAEARARTVAAGIAGAADVEIAALQGVMGIIRG